jgi:methionyl-tRNA synthetase
MPGKEDVLRYYLTKNMPEQRDSEFVWRGFQESNNNELVNNLANFVHRVLVLTNKYYEGVVPDFDENATFDSASEGDLPAFHETELLDLYDKLDAICQDIRDFEFRAGLTKLMAVSAAGNQLLQFNEPWKLQKEDPDTVKAIMNLGIQYVAAISVACEPFLPNTSAKLREMLNLPPVEGTATFLDMMNALAEGEPLVASGHKIGTPEHLFTRIDDSVIDAQVEKLKRETEDQPEEEAVELKPEISYSDFTKLDMRTGTILSAEPVKKANKLLKLEVDLGFEKRTVVSGIAKHYDPDSIIGRQVVLLANLAPREMFGIESQGMILMAEDADGKLSFVSPEENWDNGSPIS